MTIVKFPTDFRKLSAAKRRALQQCAPSLASDAMHGRQTMDAGIKPIGRGMKLIGQARTVLARGDNSPAMAAIPLMRPGEVMVVDAGEGALHATWGDITTLEAAQRGVSGVVVGGAVRDTADIIEMGFPVFCRAITLRGPAQGIDGAIDVPIVVGGVTVRPGDVIFGDDDGVVVIPLEDLDAVIAGTRAKLVKEKGWIAAVRAGGSLAGAIGVPDPEPMS